jgi:hypothetical protein
MILRVCIATGCPQITGSKWFCETHWHKLPLKVRRRWWRETDFGRNEPNEDLLREIDRVLVGEAHER